MDIIEDGVILIRGLPRAGSTTRQTLTRDEHIERTEAEFESEMNAAITASGVSTILDTKADYVVWENQLGYMAFARSLGLAYSAYAIGSDLDSVIATLEFLRIDPEQFVITE